MVGTPTIPPVIVTLSDEVLACCEPHPVPRAARRCRRCPHPAWVVTSSSRGALGLAPHHGLVLNPLLSLAAACCFLPRTAQLACKHRGVRAFGRAPRLSSLGTLLAATCQLHRTSRQPALTAACRPPLPPRATTRACRTLSSSRSHAGLSGRTRWRRDAGQVSLLLVANPPQLTSLATARWAAAVGVSNPQLSHRSSANPFHHPSSRCPFCWVKPFLNAAS